MRRGLDMKAARRLASDTKKFGIKIMMDGLMTRSTSRKYS